MKVILKETVQSLGNVGDVVNVSPGYGRNFLIPNELAVLADESNKKQLAHFNKMLAKRMQEEKGEAEGIKKKLEGKSFEFVKKVGGSGKLFGTVTSQEVSAKLAEEGIEVEKRLIMIDTPIKALGDFTVKAKLFSDVEANFNIKVSQDPKQAEEMKKRQEAMAKKKAEKAAAEAAKAEAGESEEAEAPQTEEQKLQEEANKVTKE